MAPKLGKVVAQDEGAPTKTSRDTSVLQSHGNSKTSYLIGKKKSAKSD